MNEWQEAQEALRESWGKDVVFALGTRSEEGVNVRNVDGFYMNGSIYVTSYALSHKVKDIAEHPEVGLCDRLSVARGVAENLGHPCQSELAELREQLKQAFHLFYDRHVDESDPNTCVLRIRLTEAVLFARSKRYAISFADETAVSVPFVSDIIAPEDGG